MFFDVIRWTTIHPALVHLPAGTLPLAFVVFALAYARRSERLTFTADVIQWAGAVGAVLAAAFGIVAYAMASWPGGLGPWPAVHLVLGLATALTSVLVVLHRGKGRKEKPTARAADVGASLAAALLVIATGWVGGQALVYHAGMAVEAGGQGSMAPHFSWSESPPGGVHDAMGRLRATWGSLLSTAAVSTVQEPGAIRYATMAADADRMRSLSHFLATDAVQRMDDAERARKFLEVALEFDRRVGQLQTAASARDLPAIQSALGGVSAGCADCHEKLRWTGP